MAVVLIINVTFTMVSGVRVALDGLPVVSVHWTWFHARGAPNICSCLSTAPWLPFHPAVVS